MKSKAAIRIGDDTYEAVDVSHFKNGRTKCVRPVSEESLVFVVLCCRKIHLVKHWMPHWPNIKHALKLANSVKVQIVTCWV
nr:choline/carnitine O-acyltransferase [Neisseria subflava]